MLYRKTLFLKIIIIIISTKKEVFGELGMKRKFTPSKLMVLNRSHFGFLIHIP